MVMKASSNRVPDTPPNLINALITGFDTITNHLELIIIPVVLDLFLWLGPRLRLEGLIKGVVSQMNELSGLAQAQAGEPLLLGQELWNTFAERLNFFAVLRSYPVGVPSLMASNLPTDGPLGIPPAWEIPSFGLMLAVWLGLSLIGLTFGSLYFLMVADVSVEGEVSWRKVLNNLPRVVFQVVLLTILCFAILVAISLPSSCLISFVTISGLPFAQISLFLLAGFVLWMLFPLVFSAHGIFVNRSKMWVSLLDGMRLTRLTFSRTGLLFIILLVISEVSELLWRVPGASSWFSLIGIAGHAFTTTGILAASIVYYRDAHRWLQRLIQQAKFSSLTQLT